MFARVAPLYPCLVVALSIAYLFSADSLSRVDAGEIIRRRVTTTLTAVELNHGDSLEFILRSGQPRTLTLIDTWARVLLTNLENTRNGHSGGGTVYTFGCTVTIDGQPMQMVRYVPVQASFYEPYVVDGMRIWLDGVRAIGELFNENHGDCLPHKHARFAVQDATLPICVDEELRPWYPNGDNRIDVHSCYNGDDVWMGTYFGADLHGGLDINMPIGTPLWCPIRCDDQFFFNSLAAGQNNNRWRATRRWDNGQRWVLQTHHITRLLVPEHTPLQQGTHYAVAAGVLTGSHAHSHFVFKIGAENEEVLLDPWILFRQIFENNKRRSGAIDAEIAPAAPARTGEQVVFHATGSRAGVTGNTLTHCWTFGDGGCSVDAHAAHVFSKPGVYPVTLVVRDGVQLAATTQHICVSGTPVEAPVLNLNAPGEVEFALRPVTTMDVYGEPPSCLPNTLRFVARPSSAPRPAGKRVETQNMGTGTLERVEYSITYDEIEGWARIARQGNGNSQALMVYVDAKKLKTRHGVYHALVRVDCPGAVNSPQCFGIELTIPPRAPNAEIIVDNDDPSCYKSPYSWLAPRFYGPWPLGYGGTYLIAGDTSMSSGFVRYQPDLAAGTYAVSLLAQTPFRPTRQTDPEIRFPVRVRHHGGVEVVWVEPLKSLTIGTFEFNEGTDGFVQVETKGAKGLVVADAVRFQRIETNVTPDYSRSSSRGGVSRGRCKEKDGIAAQHIGEYVSKDMAFFDEAGARIAAPQQIARE